MITARHAVAEVMEMLKDNKTPAMSFDAWFVLKNFAYFETIRNLFVDEHSHKVLSNILMAMLTGNESRYLSFAFDNDQYFCLPQYNNCGNDVFVDAGAYVGDTIERFIFSQNGDFKKIYAFEPGKRQFFALEKRINRLIDEWALDKTSISIINAALGEKKSSAYIKTSAHLTQTSISQSEQDGNSDSIQVYSLDELQIPVSFIKADIEGSEIEMLNGAKETITKYKPKIAISVYHKPDDLFKIIEILKKLVPDYSFSLRHHSSKLIDTTLYCFVD